MLCHGSVQRTHCNNAASRVHTSNTSTFRSADGMMQAFNNKPQFIIAESFTGGFAIYFAKVPVLVLLDRLFGIRKWLRVTVWTAIGAGFATFLASLLYVSVECSAAKVHDAVDGMVCIDSASTNGLVHGAASLVLDVVAFIIPVPILWNLKISKSKKIGLGAVFGAGIL